MTPASSSLSSDVNGDGSEIRVAYRADDHLTWKDAVAISSMLIFMFPAMLPTYFVLSAAPSPATLGRLPGLVGLILILTVPCGLVFKYLWLLVMSRVVGKSHVGPIISYGIPRRLSRFDRALLERHFRY